MNPEHATISQLEKRSSGLQETIITRLNEPEILSTGRTGVCITWHHAGREIYEMILNKNGQWPGITTPNNQPPTLEDLLEQYAHLRDAGFSEALREAERSFLDRSLAPDEAFKHYFEVKRKYIEENKPRLLFELVGAMDAALEELSNS